MGDTVTVVLGSGAALPRRVVTNEELTARLDTTDEWIRSRTGIGARRVVGPGVATSDLAVAAGREALCSAGLDGTDAVIVATTTPDRPCPATAPEVASRLGMSGVAAHDVAAVCTGFLYGLAGAAGLIATGIARTVLLIGAEAFTTIVDPADRSTAVIFGDGAGAVVLGGGRSGDRGEVGPCVLGSDGSRADLIEIPGGGARRRTSGQPAEAGEHYFRMRGQEVFRLAVPRMAEVARAAVARAGLGLDQLDLVVPHQANARISAALGRRLNLPAGRMLSNVEQVGNTAAASIPVLLAEAGADGRLKPGQRLLLVAFGGGLTWGATTLVWPDVTPTTVYC
jgi:3-oxoacyl-[acyl-carrier-protein] synthase III